MGTARERIPKLIEVRNRGWQFENWTNARILSGITDRHTSIQALKEYLPSTTKRVDAHQIHGSSVSVIQGPIESVTVRGSDALLTQEREHLLVIRTADCLPVFIVDPTLPAVGLVHAGWRGLAADILARAIAQFRHAFHSSSERLKVALGPALRDCCYEVGPEFEERFGPFVRTIEQKRYFDLVGAAKQRLQKTGIVERNILDTHACTACMTDVWYSFRKEGSSAERLQAWMLIR